MFGLKCDSRHHRYGMMTGPIHDPNERENVVRRLTMVVLALLAAVTAGADIVPAYVELEPDQQPITLLVVPDGSGPGFAEARCDDGSVWGRPLRLRPFFYVWGGGPDPQFAPGFPAEDALLVSDDGLPCPGGSIPDGPADAEGWLTWTNPVAAGGAMAGATVRLWTLGLAFDEALPITFTSPDLTGDDQVNLSDIAVFTQELGGGAGSAADLNADGVVNLSDIALFVPAIGAVCP